MKNLTILLLAALLPILPASAETEIQKVTSDSTEETGATAQVQKREDGTFGFTVTRFLNKPVDESAWIIEGTAELEIRNKGGLLAKTFVASKKQNDTVVYRFSLSRDCIPTSHFAITERAHPNDNARPDRLGRSRYEFDLPEIAALTLKATAPLHP